MPDDFLDVCDMRSLAIFRHCSWIICRADLAHLEKSQSTTNYAKNDEDSDTCGERGRLHGGRNERLKSRMSKFSEESKCRRLGTLSN